MKSPVKELRLRLRWNKKQLADVLGTSTKVITEVEEGKKRLPDKFYKPLRKIGEDPDKLGVDQENFIKWRKDLYSSMKWGLGPPNHKPD